MLSFKPPTFMLFAELSLSVDSHHMAKLIIVGKTVERKMDIQIKQQ